MKTRIKICSWNINGVKNKFTNDDVHKFLAEYDVLCISESHFDIRSKCPKILLLSHALRKLNQNHQEVVSLCSETTLVI